MMGSSPLCLLTREIQLLRHCVTCVIDDTAALHHRRAEIGRFQSCLVGAVRLPESFPGRVCIYGALAGLSRSDSCGDI